MSTTLTEFLNEIQTDVQAQIDDSASFAELVFSEIVMHHMAEIGMTFEHVVCHYSGKIGNANLRLTGYALSDDADQLDLFVSKNKGVNQPTPITDSENLAVLQQCLRFLTLCATGKMAQKIEPSNDAHSLALNIHTIYGELEQIRIFILTDCVSKSKNFKTREIGGKAVKLEVMDIERLHRHWSEGKPRDELVVDFAEVSGSPLPCVFVPGSTDEYDYALTAIPGEALRFLYERFGARLLEANVRSFLSIKSSKGVNAGIQGTLRSAPGRFMAYNNGIVVVADEMKLGQSIDGSLGIASLRGLQIVNGGQTTASIYFAKRKFLDIDLTKVRVPAKIIVLKEQDVVKEDALISDISRFANTQNVVRQSDLSANKPFHIDVERLSLTVFCPDGVGRWFYERAAGSYNTLLAREGTTPAKLRTLKEAIPPSRKITKTDLAKYLMAWDGRPDVVCFGNQKCFDKFMATMMSEDGFVLPAPNTQQFKSMIAKAIVFKKTHKMARDSFQAFQANVAAYTVSMLATKFGNRFNLMRVWERQSISSELSEQLVIWSTEVNDVLHRTASGRMVSEWAKKEECRNTILAELFSDPADGIPELQ